MPLDPYRFELVFSGLCLFVLDNQGATILLVNAENPKRFAADPNLRILDRGSLPHPHFPALSYSMSQQVRSGVIPRRPERVFAGTLGEEVGVCDLAGEDLVIEMPEAQSFKPGVLDQAPKLSSLLPVELSSLCSAPIPNHAVAARIRLTQGTLETLRVGFAGLNPLQVDLRTINTKGTPSSSPPVTMAEQLILRADGVTDPVRIRSNSKDSLLLRPDLDPDGKTLRPVTANISNYHQEFFPPGEAAFDFLWFYEMLEFTTAGPRPSRADLLIPVYVNGSGGFTGSSGLCPPVTF